MKLAFVMAVGKGESLWKTGYLIESIQKHHPSADVFAFVAEEERKEIPQEYLELLLDEDVTLLFGKIPIPEYIFTVKHMALIEATKRSSADYFCCLDSDMLMLNPFEFNSNHNMYVCPVDVGNTSWGRASAQPYWDRLYSDMGLKTPANKLQPIADKTPMFPYYNGGFVITSNRNFGEEWLELTSIVFPQIESMDSYEKFRSRSKRRRFFQRIPLSHWTEQVTLTLLAEKYKAHNLGYSYDYPINIMKTVPKDTKLIHYHDMRNLRKISTDYLSEDLLEYLDDNYPKNVTRLRLSAYSIMRRTKIKLGKF